MTNDEIIQNLLDQAQIHKSQRYDIGDALEQAASPLHNEIIHLQVQLRQAQDALDVMKKLSYIAFHDLRSEGGRYPPETLQEVDDLFEILSTYDADNIVVRLNKLFEHPL